MHLNTPGFNAVSASFGKDNNDNVAYTFGTNKMRSLQKYRGNAPKFLSPMHLNSKGGDVDIDVTSFEKVESEYDDNSSNRLNYVAGNVNCNYSNNSVYKENESPTFDDKRVHADSKGKKSITKIQSGIHGDVFSKYIQGINDKNEVSEYISYNNSSEDEDEQRSKSARIQSDEEVEDDELSNEANVNANVNHFNESIIMAKQLVKALLLSKKYKANIDVIAHDYGIDMMYINNKLNQSRSMGVQTGKFNSMSLNSLRCSMGNCSFSNVYDFDYDLQVVDEVDETTEALCYLTIPRVVYFKKKLVVMMVCPMINKSNANDYWMVFKNTSTLHKVFVVLMKDITACYEKSSEDGCNKTLSIQYMNKKTFTKGVVDVTTKTKDECSTLVHCIEELINK